MEIKEHSKYKNIMQGLLNYFDLNQLERVWYNHIRKNPRNTLEDTISVPLQEGLRVWEKGILYEVIGRDGAENTLMNMSTEETVKVSDFELNYETRFDKRKRTFILDSLTEEEMDRLREVKRNETYVEREEKTKGSNSLTYKEGTIGEKIYEVIGQYAKGYLETNRSNLTDVLKFVVIKNIEEDTEVSWEDIPRDKRQEIMDLDYVDNVSRISDFFNVRYIYMKTSIKDYLPKISI